MIETRRMKSGGRCSPSGPCEDKSCKKCWRDVPVPTPKKPEEIVPSYGANLILQEDFYPKSH